MKNTLFETLDDTLFTALDRSDSGQIKAGCKCDEIPTYDNATGGFVCDKEDSGGKRRYIR